MGTITAKSLIDKAAELAQDEANVTWTRPQGLAWVNEAQLALASKRIDAAVETTSIRLAVGTHQSIDGRRLRAITRNMGSDGQTPGRAIRLVERGVKDDYSPDWHSVPGEVVVKEYVYDTANPTEFYVSPPVTNAVNVYVEINQAIVPADLSDENDPITVQDVYAPVLLEWVACRFFSRDAEEVTSLQRAAAHFQRFFAILGEKLDMDMAFSPELREQLK